MDEGYTTRTLPCGKHVWYCNNCAKRFSVKKNMLEHIKTCGKEGEMDEENVAELAEKMKEKAKEIAEKKAKEKGEEKEVVLPKGVEKPPPPLPPKAKVGQGYHKRPWNVKGASKKLDCYVCETCGKAMLSEDEMRLHVPQCK